MTLGCRKGRRGVGVGVELGVRGKQAPDKTKQAQSQSYYK